MNTRLMAHKIVLIALLSLIFYAGAAALGPGEASAQVLDDAHSVSFQERPDNEFYLAPRMRAIVVPSWILGMWYDEHSTHWDGQTNLAYGLEFVWRKVGAYEISTAIEYADLSMPNAFWLESGDPAQKADYTEIDLQLLSLVISGYWYWDVEEWFAPYVGGGIGIGMVLGDIYRFKAQSGSACADALGGTSGFAPNECFDDNREPQPDAIDLASKTLEDRVPGVVPVLNLTGGLRFNMGEHAIAKLEVGFYDYFFGGLSIGAQW